MRAIIDGNEAAARVAYALSEVVTIYPITPASSMGELCDAWATAERPNLWGDVPRVVQLQSEGGAAGALHGALQRGSLATTFTASQGLLLMLPNMYKIAGELSPSVIHVAARTLATHALSIFGDHSDVMSARMTGWAMLSSSGVQEAHDLAAISHAATLRTRVPFLHFFDGFRTSHEITGIDLLDPEDLRALLDEQALLAHRARGLDPDRPVLRGSAQNPDVFFQAREAANPFHASVPGAVQEAMDQLALRTGRSYRLVEYHGHEEAERVVVLMGSATGAASEAVDELNRQGQRVGVLTVRLYRPFPVEALLAALPPTVRGITVLDRVKEPGAVGEPLHTDVVTALAEAVMDGRLATLPRVTGGRYGLSSKEFTPALAAAALADLEGDPKPRFTLGITDDVTHLSLPPADLSPARPAGELQAVFYGLGSDGTVGANKNTVKIVGEHADLHAQGYFVYDSKKSGAVTVSHLRFSPEPIRSSYLVDQADFVACHQPGFLDRRDVLRLAKPGATFLLNTHHAPDQVWDHLPREAQEDILDKGLRLWVVDAYKLARELGLGGRINTVMQACFFTLSGILPESVAVGAMKGALHKTYGQRGEEVVTRNHRAVDRALEELAEVKLPELATATHRRLPPVPDAAPDFVQQVTARMLADEGDLLPVSAFPVDGTFPTGTARWEKRGLATELPIWDADLCIDCGKCAIVCPHSAILMNVVSPDTLDGAPDGFPSKSFRSKEVTGHHLTIQVAPDDCTGCGVCVEVCPARSKEAIGHKALTMCPASEHRDVERERYAFVETLPPLDPAALAADTVKGSQVRKPLFEFSGACSGCGETPYLKLISQLFGDRIIVANATGCSSIYGGNLPTTPWTTDGAGRGPAWANSLFEDNAEFGMGIRLGVDQQATTARRLLRELAPVIGGDLARAILAEEGRDDAAVARQRERIAALRVSLEGVDGQRSASVTQLLSVADALVPKQVWIVGGDGWAYDIGFGGLDHVLASGEDVNVIVLDTEVYSNTGGQASKSTPRGAVAKFAAAGKAGPKKDLGLLAMQYGNVYVGQIAMGASDAQAVKVMAEAAAWQGPSLILAYSTCIAHGIDMRDSMAHQRHAVKSGYWPLFRFHPGADEHETPLKLDSRPPSMPISQFTASEGRFAMLARSQPDRAQQLADLAQRDVDERWRYYEQLAGVERTIPEDLEEMP